MDNSIIFSPFTSIDNLVSVSDYQEFFRDYFVNTSVCWEVLGLGLLISVVLCLAFYLVIGNRVYVLSKRWMWLVFLIVSSVAVYFTTQSYIIGTDGESSDDSTGLYEQSYMTESRLVEEEGYDSKDVARLGREYRDVFRERNSDEGASLPGQIALVNMIYSLIVFVGLSFAVKGHTIHAKAIPV